MGSAIIFAAMAGQQQPATPWEPPTEVLLFQGKRKDRFSIEQGARNVARFLKSAADEMAHAVRMIGKEDVYDVGPEDMCALDEETARITGVELAFPSHHS